MKKLVISSLVMVVAGFGFGFAQETTELRQLQREARQLEILQRLPEESRADAEVLLTRAADLADVGLALRTSNMQAYVDALDAGEQPLVAREIARQAVAEERLALIRDMATLREDIQGFTDTYPEVRELMGEARLGRGLVGGRFGQGERGEGFSRSGRGGEQGERQGRSGQNGGRARFGGGGS
ncbi:MAG: hypothetical protein AAF267_14295 [Deinococcota bacterium]